jgi:hypothetical protein
MEVSGQLHSSRKSDGSFIKCLKKLLIHVTGFNIFQRVIFSGLPSNLRSLMNKKARFKVALERYLNNTRAFYSVQGFLTFKNDSCKSFLLLFLHGPPIVFIYFMSTLFCYLHSILKKYLPIVSLFCFFVVLLLLHLSVCFTPHPVVGHYKLTDPRNVCM